MITLSVKDLEALVEDLKHEHMDYVILTLNEPDEELPASLSVSAYKSSSDEAIDFAELFSDE